MFAGVKGEGFAEGGDEVGVRGGSGRERGRVVLYVAGFLFRRVHAVSMGFCYRVSFFPSLLHIHSYMRCR